MGAPSVLIQDGVEVSPAPIDITDDEHDVPHIQDDASSTDTTVDYRNFNFDGRLLTREHLDRPCVLVEILNGIMSMALALEEEGVFPVGHFYSDTCKDAQLMANHHWPDALSSGDVELITHQQLESLFQRFEALNVLWIIVGGPPCVDVSLLNSGRTGAHGAKSGLRDHFQRIVEFFYNRARDSTVALMECTRMEPQHRAVYEQSLGSHTWELCSRWWVPLTRPRRWWTYPQPSFPDWVQLAPLPFDPQVTEVCPLGVERLRADDILEPGWVPFATHPTDGSQPANPEEFCFRCLTRRQARQRPMPSPRGLDSCDLKTLEIWQDNSYDQAPYHYKPNNPVRAIKDPDIMRRLISNEEERAMSFPTGYTSPLRHKYTEHKQFERQRQSLLGNAWRVKVARFWVQVLILPWLGRASEFLPEKVLQLIAASPVFVQALHHHHHHHSSFSLECGWRDKADLS